MYARTNRPRTLGALGWRVEPARGARRILRDAWFAVRGTRSELRRIVWPTRRQALSVGIAVGVVSVAVALLLGGLDLTSAELFGTLLRRP